MLGVFAKFERAMIVERVHAGLKRAKAQGKRLGRPRVGGPFRAPRLRPSAPRTVAASARPAPEAMAPPQKKNLA